MTTINHMRDFRPRWIRRSKAGRYIALTAAFLFLCACAGFSYAIIKQHTSPWECERAGYKPLFLRVPGKEGHQIAGAVCLTYVNLETEERIHVKKD